MPYISKERVKEIRDTLKKKYPNVKFSVTRKNNSVVCIAILKSPYTWCKDYLQVNHYYPQSYENYLFLQDVINIANEGNKTEYYDADYGNIPTFYVDITVGNWDQPHQTI